MKKNIFFLLFSLVILISGCSVKVEEVEQVKEAVSECITPSSEKVSKNLDITSFNSIEVRGPFNVHLIQSDTPYVKVEASDNSIDMADIFGVGNNLIIKEKESEIKFCYFDIKVEVGVKEIYKLESFGSGDVSSDVLDFENNDLSIKSLGSGDIQLSGEVGKLNIENNGSGNILLFGFESSNVNVKNTGSGNIDVNTRSLTTSIEGSGNIIYKQIDAKTPIVVKSNNKGSGAVIGYTQEQYYSR